MATWYIVRKDRATVGTLEADDAFQAQELAETMHGEGAYAIHESLAGPAEKFLGKLRDELADGGGRIRYPGEPAD